jgi:hypothetical protein
LRLPALERIERATLLNIKNEAAPERFAQQAFGHCSKAFVRVCSKTARVVVPSLEDYEAKIMPMPMAGNQ